MEILISDDGFVATLTTLNGGAVLDELDRAMIQCVQAIRDHGGKAELTLKVRVERIKNMASAVSVSADEVKVKAPKEDRISKVLFITPGAGLTDQTQKQEPLDLGAPIAPRGAALTPVTNIGTNTNGK